MPRPKKAIKFAETKVHNDPFDNSKIETIKGKELVMLY
jgi:hypothetical protein